MSERQNGDARRQIGGGSLLEGIETAPRRPIDASWSIARKRLVSVGAAALAIAALGAGGWAWWVNRPVSLPTSASEAIALMSSERFDRLSEDRRASYAAEAARLFRELSEEQRRALREAEGAREAWRELMRQRMDEMARRVARGEEIERPERPAGPPREVMERFRNMTDEERAAMRERRIAQMNESMNERMTTGNSQSGALMSEMVRSRFAQGGRGGRRGGPRGGGG